VVGVQVNGRLSLERRRWILQSPPKSCADAVSARRLLQDDIPGEDRLTRTLSDDVREGIYRIVIPA
jgi:hypothetical protein